MRGSCHKTESFVNMTQTKTKTQKRAKTKTQKKAKTKTQKKAKTKTKTITMAMTMMR